MANITLNTRHPIGLNAKVTFLAPRRGSKAVLRNTELLLIGGKITCLLGPSGAGKTTLIRMLGGDKSVDFRGLVEYLHLSSTTNVTDAAGEGRIGLFLPDGALPPWQSVSAILGLPARLNLKLKTPSKSDIESVLGRLRLPRTVLLKLPSELSLGMRHRVLLALALLYKPAYYFVDEIFSTLDQPTADLALQELKSQVAQGGSTCLITTHDLDRALAIGDEFYYKDLGESLTRLDQPTRAGMIHLFESDHSKFLTGDES